MGKSVRNKLARNPTLQQYYESYDLCRTKMFVTFRKPGRKQGEERIVTAVFPTGFSILPREGGLDDQSYLITKIFSAAMRGEMDGFRRVIADKQHVR